TVSTEAEWLDVEPHEGYFSVVIRPRPGTNRANVVVRDRATGATKTLRVRVRAGGEPPSSSSSSDALPREPAPPGAKPDAGGERARAPLGRLTGRNRTLAIAGAAVVTVLV